MYFSLNSNTWYWKSILLRPSYKFEWYYICQMKWFFRIFHEMSTNFPFVILRKCESMDSTVCSFFIFCNLKYPFSHKRTFWKKDKKFVCDTNSIRIIYLRTKNVFLFNFLIDIEQEFWNPSKLNKKIIIRDKLLSHR